MEGSCAVIHEESRTTVRKVLRKGYKGLSARQQADIQRRAREVLEEHGLTSLTVPRVLVIEERSYVMERIDDSKPLYDYTLTPKQLTELKVFLSVMEGNRIIMNDIECYVQPDGRIAIIDFDKCEYTDKKGFVRRKANAFLPCI
jgi:hypothetical protein